jgi:hypothetical protein
MELEGRVAVVVSTREEGPAPLRRRHDRLEPAILQPKA